MRSFVKEMIVRSLMLASLLLLSATVLHAADSPKSEKLDSVIAMLEKMPDDSTRLRQCFISIQENIDQHWTLELIEYAQKQADRQKHLIWGMAFRGSKVRWTHRFHDWERMDKFLEAQRTKAKELEIYGNYMSQIGQSAIVMAQMGRFEQSMRYIRQMEKDLEEAGEEHYKRYEIYKYLVNAEYCRYSGDEEKRLELLLAALDDNVQTSPLQRVSLHIELIDVFRHKGDYNKALAHADSVLSIYNGFSPERKALPQSRGSISEANLRKVELYQKLKNLPMMYKSLKTAEEYVNTTDPKNLADLYRWWAKYYFEMKDYARSMQFQDKAVAIYHEHLSEEYAINTELEEVKLLSAMGREHEALDLYTAKLLALDSVHNVMIVEQQEYLDALSNILSQRQRSEDMHVWQTCLVVLFAFILSVIVFSILVYLIMVRRKLKRNYNITKEKLKEANDADKEKERFLRNITKLINEPLQHVVNGAKRLSEDSAMTQDEQVALVATNNEHVHRLLELVNNVLDLSRLEAGMMRYSVRTVDIVGRLNDFVSDYNMHNMLMPVRIVSDVESYMMAFDDNRLAKMVETLFSVPFNCGTPIPSHRSIRITNGDAGCLVVTITGSLFADESRLGETERMTNRINRFVMADFGSSYEITSGFEIVLTFNSR